MNDSDKSRSAKVGATAGALSAAATTAAPPSMSGAAGLTFVNLSKWLSIGLLVGSAVTWLAVRTNAPVTGRAPALRAKTAERLPPPDLPVPPSPSTAAPTSAEPPPLAAGVAPTGLNPRPSASVAPPSDRERLAEEVAVVERARTEFARGRSSQVLAALDDYAERFPIQRFAPEALYMRMEALLAVGQRSAALDTAQRLSTRYPKSPQAPRARQLLEKTLP